MRMNPAMVGALAAALLAVGSANAEILVADPSIAAADGRYYLVGTENRIGAKPYLPASGKNVFPLYVSTDLHDWHLADTPLGEGRLLAKEDAFGKDKFWAPQLFRRNGRWFFAYTSDFHWGIASAERPEGPFKTFVEFPRNKIDQIDPTILQDDDGRVYAHFSRGGVVGVELSADLTHFIGEIVTCVTNDQPWEHKPLEKHYKDLNAKFGYMGWVAYRHSPGVIEGPSVVKRHGKYVMFYSANDFRSPDYCVGVAVADRPLGPFRKLQDGPVLSRDITGLNGTGHGDIFTAADGSLWYVFHAHNSNIRIAPRRTGVIRLIEKVGPDGFPRYAAEITSLRLF